MDTKLNFMRFLIGDYDGLSIEKQRLRDVLKHLPGKHDQESHAGKHVVDAAYSDIEVKRTDTDERWEQIGLKRMTDDELKAAFGLPGAGEIRVKNGSEDDIVITATGTAGHLHRELYRGIKGPEIAHTGFHLTNSQQHKGIGTDLSERAEKVYQRVGIKRIVLSADSSVGSYAWPRMGFDFNGDDTRNRVVGEFYNELHVRGIKDRPPIEHSWDLAAWQGEGYSGKEFLLKKQIQYDASKTLESSDEGYRVGQLYYRLRHKQNKHLLGQHNQASHGRKTTREIEHYVIDSSNINKQLRDGIVSDEAKQIDRELIPISEGMTVYRGVDRITLESMKSGNKDDAFLSTTKTDAATFGYGSILTKLILPKGIKAFDVSVKLPGLDFDDKEVVLERGLSFKYVGQDDDAVDIFEVYKSEEFKHLPGKHNQADHAGSLGGRGGGDDSIKPDKSKSFVDFETRTTADISLVDDISAYFPIVSGKAYWFNRLISGKPGLGGGNKVLKEVLSYIDKAGIPLVNQVNAYGNLSQSDLAAFYKRNGFERVSDEFGDDLLIYKPRKSK